MICISDESLRHGGDVLYIHTANLSDVRYNMVGGRAVVKEGSLTICWKGNEAGAVKERMARQSQCEICFRRDLGKYFIWLRSVYIIGHRCTRAFHGHQIVSTGTRDWALNHNASGTRFPRYGSEV